MRSSFPRFNLALGWLALVLCFGVSSVSAGDLRPFTAKSLDELRRENAGKPFVVAFWSLHCAPCKEELAVLKTLHGKHPSLPIVLVATDPPQQKDAIRQFLSQYELGKLQTWSLAEDFDERIRFAIDRRWRGELPRTYFFDAAHRSTAHSGLVDAGWLETWLARETAQPRK
jgi:thiol-disulfide isomerase/thioredoxin